jgi:hypothetical protein
MRLILVFLLVASFGVEARCFNNGGKVYCEPDYRGDGNSPMIIDRDGNYRGNLNGNRYDPNSVSNPYGRYGSEYSSESINNPYVYPSLDDYGN